MNANDATSLDRLHDLVTPPAVPWWPPAPGWYVVLAVGAVLFAWAAVKLALAWWRDRYRRAALAELVALRGDSQSGFLGRLDELLKRTALATYPREHVAALSGSEWLAFLDRTGGAAAFTSGPGRALGTGPYARETSLDAAAREGILTAASAWVQHHRRGDTC